MIDDFKWWKPSHWRVQFAMWRGQRERRKIMSDEDLFQAIDICTKVAGQHIAWKEAEGMIAGVYFGWDESRHEMESRAQELGKLSCDLFAEILVKGLKEHFGGNNERA